MTDEGNGPKRRGDPLGDIRLGFDGLLTTLGQAISEISDRLEAGQSGEFRRSFELDTGKGPVRAEAGVRVRYADAGGPSGAARGPRMARPVNAGTGKDQERRQATANGPIRPIDFEILADAETWRLTADIPGVDQTEISLSISNGDLRIETTGSRRFAGSASLPEGVTLDDLEMSLRNGILELSCSVAGEGRG